MISGRRTLKINVGAVLANARAGGTTKSRIITKSKEIIVA
jgi:hypothetical protein